MEKLFELKAIYDSRKTFYGKATVKMNDDGSMELYSYNTKVASIDNNGKYTSYGKWSNTTTRHQKEFKKQFEKETQ